MNGLDAISEVVIEILTQEVILKDVPCLSCLLDVLNLEPRCGRQSIR